MIKYEYHCDREDCNTWSSNGDQFILVMYDALTAKHYCCKWCMVVEESRYAEPTETIDL